MLQLIAKINKITTQSPHNIKEQSTMKTIGNLRYASRSVITDKIYNEDKQNQYQRHAQKLVQIKGQKRAPKSYQSGDLLPYLDTNRNNNSQDFLIKRIQQSKKAAKKIREIFDETKLQNQSLRSKLQKIHFKRSQSISHMEMRGSTMKKNYQQVQKEKQIKYNNRKLIQNILIERGKILSKKELKKQFKQYEEYKSLHIKIKKEGQQKEIKKKKILLQQPQMNLYVREYESDKKKQQTVANEPLQLKKKSKNKKSLKKESLKHHQNTSKTKQQIKPVEQKINEQQKGYAVEPIQEY